MERATLDRILQLANETDPVIEAPDFDVNGRYFTRNKDGSLVADYAERAPSSTQLFSTKDLAAHVQADVAATEAHANVYYAPDVISAELAIEGIRWRHTLRLPLHPAFQAVQDLTRSNTFRQRDLIRFLRATLNGHVDDAVVEQFRTLKVATDGESNSVLAKGREAVDKRIQQQVTAAAGGLIPDEIEVTVPVYDLDECRDDLYPVTLLVEATTEEDKVVFEVTTVLNTLRAAQRNALDVLAVSLQESLKRDGTPVYHGRA